MQAEFAARNLVPVGSEQNQQIMIHNRLNVPKPRSRDGHFSWDLRGAKPEGLQNMGELSRRAYGEQ